MLRKTLLTLATIVALTTATRAASLPRLEADALGGTHVVLPDDAAGKALVLLIDFTPEAAEDLKQWSRAILADKAAAGAAVYVVIVADRSFLSHRRIRSLVENAAIGTREQTDRDVLLTFSGEGWKTLTPPGDKRAAGVVVCAPSGAIAFAQRVSYRPDVLAGIDRLLK